MYIDGAQLNNNPEGSSAPLPVKVLSPLRDSRGCKPEAAEQDCLQMLRSISSDFALVAAADALALTFVL